MNIKKEFLIQPSPSHFSEKEKAILKRAMAAMHLQENEYYDEEKNDYTLKWQEIFFLLLTEEEKTSGFGYFMTQFAWNLWNDLIFLCEEVFSLPTPPVHLSRSNWRHRETEEYQTYLRVYENKKIKLIQEILHEWENIKEKVIEEKTA